MHAALARRASSAGLFLAPSHTTGDATTIAICTFLVIRSDFHYFSAFMPTTHFF